MHFHIKLFLAFAPFSAARNFRFLPRQKNDMQFSAQSNSNKLSSIFPFLCQKLGRMQFHFEITLLFSLKSCTIFFRPPRQQYFHTNTHNLHLLLYCSGRKHDVHIECISTSEQKVKLKRHRKLGGNKFES